MPVQASTSAKSRLQAVPEVENARMVQKYVRALHYRKGLDDKTIGHHRAAIRRFDALMSNMSYKAFNSHAAMKFRKALEAETNARTGELLAKSTTDPILLKVRAFFEWLSREPGYKSRLHSNDIEYLTPLKAEARRRHAKRIRKFPSIRQAVKAFDQMPVGTVLQRRNKAYVGMHLLTSGRAAAVVSLPLQAFDYKGERVIFDARYCATKGQKSFVAHFNPVPKRIGKFIRSWARELEVDYGFTPTDPMFPKASPNPSGERKQMAPPVLKEFYKGTHVLGTAFKNAFAAIGLNEITTHSIRSSVHHHVDELAKTNADRKAFSLNLGHDSITTTLESYLPLSDAECSKLMKRIRKRSQKVVK